MAVAICVEKHLARVGCKNQSCEYPGCSSSGTSGFSPLALHAQKMAHVCVPHAWLEPRPVPLEGSKALRTQLHFWR